MKSCMRVILVRQIFEKRHDVMLRPEIQGDFDVCRLAIIEKFKFLYMIKRLWILAILGHMSSYLFSDLLFSLILHNQKSSFRMNDE